MIEYIIKSTISIFFLYVCYYILLKNNKDFVFNRFYLLATILISLILPTVKIRFGYSVSIGQNFQEITTSTTEFIAQKSNIDDVNNIAITWANIITIIYVAVSILLFFRLLLNLFRIFSIIRKGDKPNNIIPNIVLVKEKSLPYSFFSFIIVNKNDYDNQSIDNELIIHEQVHCNQFHSIDILMVEVVKVFLWFNPLIWILKKEIQLNHEYLADQGVLVSHDLKNYQ